MAKSETEAVSVSVNGAYTGAHPPSPGAQTKDRDPSGCHLQGAKDLWCLLSRPGREERSAAGENDDKRCPPRGGKLKENSTAGAGKEKISNGVEGR